MKQLFILLMFFIAPLTILAQDLTGAWEGKLRSGGKTYAYNLYLSKLSEYEYGGVLFVKQSSVGTATSNGYGRSKTITLNDMFEKKPWLKASISGTFANSTLTYHVISTFEHEGNTNNWQFPAISFSYNSSEQKKILIATSISNLQLSKTNDEFPVEYTQYLVKPSTGLTTVNSSNDKNIKKELNSPQVSYGQNNNSNNASLTQTPGETGIQANVNSRDQAANTPEARRQLIIHFLTDYPVAVTSIWAKMDSMKSSLTLNGKLGEYVGDIKRNEAWGKGKLYSNGELLLDGTWWDSYFVGRALERKNLPTSIQNYSSDIMDIFASQEFCRRRDADNVYIPGAIKKTSYSAANKTVRAEFDYIDRKKNSATGWVEVGIDSNLPIYTRSSYMPALYISVLDLNWTNPSCFTIQEQKLIEKSYLTFQKKMRQENASFQEVMRNQNAHSSDMQGLYTDVVFETVSGGTGTQTVPVYNSDGSIGIATVKKDNGTATVRHTVLVNPTDRTMYLKGLSANRDYEGKLTYVDETMTLPPNSKTVIDYANILFSSNYDDIKDEKILIGVHLGNGIRDPKKLLMTNSE